MDEQKRPTPERRRLSLTQAALGRPIPKGLELALGMKAWSDNALAEYSMSHFVFVHSAAQTSFSENAWMLITITIKSNTNNDLLEQVKVELVLESDFDGVSAAQKNQNVSNGFAFFIFILLSRESGGGAMRRTNPDALRSCLYFQVFRLNFASDF